MGMNSQLHLTLETGDLDRLRKEAEQEEVSVAEIIRRKLASPPQPSELLLLRQLKRKIKLSEDNQ